ncbi:MAG TPA: hypothetical protein VFQ41_22725 [Candidatus Angelobacter sp.]|nr:hypothetical protein [Candidatus Angelobacter sp.]
MNKVALLLLCVLAGCSGDLSRGKAADLMQEKFTYYEDAHFDVFVGKVGKCDAHLPARDPSTDAVYRLLAKLGYVSIRPAERGYWWVSFTEAGNNVVKTQGSWSPGSGKPLKENGCERYSATLILAKMKREPPTITGISTNDKLAVAEYRCGYELTDLGRKLSLHEDLVDSLPIQQRLDLAHAILARSPMNLPISEDDCGGSYIFQKYDDGWRMQ